MADAKEHLPPILGGTLIVWAFKENALPLLRFEGTVPSEPVRKLDFDNWFHSNFNELQGHTGPKAAFSDSLFGVRPKMAFRARFHFIR